MNRCWVYGNDMSGCSVFGWRMKNELVKFVRFFGVLGFLRNLFK